MNSRYDIFNRLDSEEKAEQQMSRGECDAAYQRFCRLHREIEGYDTGKKKGQNKKAAIYVRRAAAAVILAASLCGVGAHAAGVNLSDLWKRTVFSGKNGSGTDVLSAPQVHQKEKQVIQMEQYALDENGFLFLFIATEDKSLTNSLCLETHCDGEIDAVKDVEVRRVERSQAISGNDTICGYSISCYVPQLLRTEDVSLHLSCDRGSARYDSFDVTQKGKLVWQEQDGTVTMSAFGIVARGNVSLPDKIDVEDTACRLISQGGAQEELQVSSLYGIGEDTVIRFSPEYKYQAPEEDGKIWNQEEYDKLLYSFTTKIFDVDTFERLETRKGEVLLKR